MYSGALAFSENQRVFRTLLREGHLSGRVLDIGCGTGLMLDWCSEWLPPSSYQGFDISPGMVAEAQRKHPTYRFALSSNTHTCCDMDSVHMLFATPSYLADLGTMIHDVWDMLPVGGRIAVMTFGLGKTHELGQRFFDAAGVEVPWKRYGHEELYWLLECAGFEHVLVDPLTSRDMYERTSHIKSPLRYAEVARAYEQDAERLRTDPSTAVYLLARGTK